MEDDKPVRKIEVGPPLYMESLLDTKEYHSASKKYPNTYQSSNYRGLIHFEEGQFKCRWRMGMSLTIEEQININNNLNYLMTKVSSLPSL